MSKIPQDSFELLRTICQAIYEKKGYNILTIDVRGICTMTDYFIIAEGSVSTQLWALATSIIDTVKESLHIEPLRTEGKRASDWIVVDYGECVIHLLTTDEREKYAIERIWTEGSIIDVPICS